MSLQHVFHEVDANRWHKSLDILLQTTRCHKALHATIGDDMAQTFLGIGIVDRHVETTRPDNTYDGGQRLGRTFAIDAYSALGQSVGQKDRSDIL